MAKTQPMRCSAQAEVGPSRIAYLVSSAMLRRTRLRMMLRRRISVAACHPGSDLLKTFLAPDFFDHSRTRFSTSDRHGACRSHIPACYSGLMSRRLMSLPTLSRSPLSAAANCSGPVAMICEPLSS